MISPLGPIFDAIREGAGALGLAGRSLFDFSIDEGRMRPLTEILRRDLYVEFGMVLITYSFATGVDWSETSIADEADRRTIRQALNESGVAHIKPGDDELISTVRAFAALVRSDGTERTWTVDGRPLRFAVCFQFGDHIAPCDANGSRPDSHLVVIELVHILSQSLVLRASGNVLILAGQEGYFNPLVRGALRRVHLPQPSKEEKQLFVDMALSFYKAKLEDGLTPEAIVGLTINVPNRGVEEQIRASDLGGRVLTAKAVAEQKNRDVEQLSEGTLTPLDVSRVADTKLVGRSIATAQGLLSELGRRLLAGDPNMPANVLLAGSPGCGKTDLALRAAFEGQCPAYQMENPKDGIVGSTERRSRLQMRILKEWSPNLAYIDELTEAFPVQRGGYDGDSGASKAMIAQFLTCLSDSTRQGQSLLVATTNRPEAMGAAMRSRFAVIPVLLPLIDDFPEILVTIAERISPGAGIDHRNKDIVEAGHIFYAKGANPRHMKGALSSALLALKTRTIDPTVALLAARDLCPTGDFESTVYSDLLAIKYCALRSYLPWNGVKLTEYSIPSYLDGVIDKASGDVISTVLDRKLDELRPRVNV